MALIPFEDLPSTNTPLNAANLNFNFNEVLNLICPVGKVEVFFDNNDHSNYLGFTWERTCVGRTPVGIDTTQTEFDTIGEIGGEKTHTLTIDEIPSHIHNMSPVTGTMPSGGNFEAEGRWVDGTSAGLNSYTDSAGGGQAHNILQPYQVVAFWKRVS